jgi:hypothetical protein
VPFVRRPDGGGNFDNAAASAIRAEGGRLIKQVESGGFPFDGTHTDFRPEAEWPALRPTGDPGIPLHRPARDT